MPCPECPETPDTGCLHPITTECVTYNGNDVDCANIASGQTLNQVIEQLANNDCDLQEQIEDVINSLNEKLIFRHPHIYGDITVKDEEEVKQNWEKLKLKLLAGRKY